MSIFNTSSILTFDDIYKIDEQSPHDLYYSPNCIRWNIPRESEGVIIGVEELYNLCSIAISYYKLYQDFTSSQFIQKSLDLLKSCELGGLRTMNDCLISNEDNNFNLRIDIIKNLDQLSFHLNTHTLTYYDPVSDKKIRITMSFPTLYSSIQPKTIALLYTRNNPIKGLCCVCVPLIPKEGCIDAFIEH